MDFASTWSFHPELTVWTLQSSSFIRFSNACEDLLAKKNAEASSLASSGIYTAESTTPFSRDWNVKSIQIKKFHSLPCRSAPPRSSPIIFTGKMST